ncbi:MAG: hypothetical protein KKF89_02620 [Nanoarchaeota archaeon]|nr:hypothetical protein [Nanoarchaeota archaeon]MBU1854588.1 hypothetical protein [Nanoarchaeota archaeon]
MMSHFLFLILNTFVLSIILIIDRKNLKSYLLLSFLGLIVAFIFETVMTYYGFWTYYAEPKIPLISLCTWLMYIHYLAYSYFIGTRLGGKDA